MARPLTQSDLIFPTQSLNFSTTLHSLKRSALSITNRLNSITSDSSFAISVSDAYKLPLVANERCGSWYIPPEKKAGGVYFKSTDGHMNEWSFNLRRLNLQLLDLVGGRAGGCVIVDSTRRGKSMPDALSKTVPIWCCVMNRAIFPESGPHKLHTPPTAISESERAQIEKRLDGFVKDFLDICKPSIPDLRSKLQKPLRPIWVTQASTLPETPPSFTDFHPIILCTASRRVHGNEGSEGGYIQGAADDHEAWACGLTPQLFWSNSSTLLRTNEEDLPDLIGRLVNEAKSQGPVAEAILIRPTTNLYISTSQDLDISPYDVIISCTPEPLSTKNPEHLKTKKYLWLPLATGKLGSRDLRVQLSRLPSFFESLPQGDAKILVCDPTGKDTSVGVALALLCLYSDDNGKIVNASAAKKVNKTYIKQRLTWITTTSPVLNPSRETLKSVNAFLMPDPSQSGKSTPPESPVSKLILLDAEGRVIPESEYSSINTDAAVETTAPPAKAMTIPGTIFKSFSSPNNTWSFKRLLRSKLPTHPSGTVTGTAIFTPYGPGPCLLYSEEGEFITDTGLQFTARRKYVYQLQPRTPVSKEYISVHFFDDEKARSLGEDSEDLAIGELFVEMGDLVELVDGDEGEIALMAANREKHLCGGDLYTASWKFGSGMVEAEEEKEKWWGVRYDVVGPKKDYVSHTRYVRG